MSDSPTRPHISVTKDGPYLVDGAVSVARQIIATDENGECSDWRQGEVFPERTSCALCRCGSSSLKPYCDGSHRVVAFDGTETASKAPYAESAELFEGPRVDLMDDLALCSEARFCAAKGGAWHLVHVDDDESASTVIREAGLCPSGRYTAVSHETGDRIEPHYEPSIGIVEDPSASVSGPLWVRGKIPVIGADGETYEVRNRVTLCRCGSSKNKPFCDSTHVEIGFDASE
jgi:CDGSH-type Zn-finger protein